MYGYVHTHMYTHACDTSMHACWLEVNSMHGSLLLLLPVFQDQTQSQGIELGLSGLCDKPQSHLASAERYFKKWNHTSCIHDCWSHSSVQSVISGPHVGGKKGWEEKLPLFWIDMLSIKNKKLIITNGFIMGSTIGLLSRSSLNWMTSSWIFQVFYPSWAQIPKHHSHPLSHSIDSYTFTLSAGSGIILKL